MTRPKIKLYEAQILEIAKDNVSKIADRNRELLDELDYEDLMDRVSGIITDIDWILDYADRLKDAKPTDNHDKFVQQQTERLINPTPADGNQESEDA